MADDELILGGETVLERLLEDEMRDSFIDYSMSVIVQRALPDVRDGLKPVHRRILYAMSELGLSSGRGYKKSATVVGDVLGKYHPHGDSAVYDSMVRMVQEFSLRYPLVDGQGNFGSIDGDRAAAYRYTEARLMALAAELLEDIDKETVAFTPNFDGRLEEPTVLPAKVPNLLINGSSGIAVGMATNIPPHNLREVLTAAKALIADPELSQERLEEMVTGPDFPTGGFICGRSGIEDAYRTGRGRIVMRARARIEPVDEHSERIVVTEVPFMVNKSRMIEQIAQLVRDKKLTEIRDMRDESDRDGLRVVMELKRDAIPEIVLNRLYKHTQMQSTFGTILLALVDGEPRVLTLRQMLQHFIDHRHVVVVRRTTFDLNKAEERAHILEGLKIAVDNIDEVIKIIRGSRDAEVASESLQETFELSERQAKAILDMRLSRLTGLEMEKLEEELAAVLATIEELRGILESRDRRVEIITDEFDAIDKKYGDERRSEIVGGRFFAGGRGPDRGRGDGHHGLARGIREADRSRHLPSPEAWRTRTPGYGHQGRGLGGAPLRGVRPRVPDDFHPVGSVPLVEGVAGSACGTAFARKAHREPPEHRSRRRNRVGGSGPGVLGRSLPRVLHPGRQD